MMKCFQITTSLCRVSQHWPAVLGISRHMFAETVVGFLVLSRACTGIGRNARDVIILCVTCAANYSIGEMSIDAIFRKIIIVNSTLH